MFLEIGSSESWSSVEAVNKGWSRDKKYRIRTAAGGSLLLRISDISDYAAKKKEFGIVEKYAGLGFEMSRPLEFGVCGGGKYVYMLLTWVEGRDAEEVLPQLSPEEQYRLGRKAGEILRRIHSLPAAEEDLPKQDRRAYKLYQLEQYETSAVRIPGDETAAAYVKAHIGEIWKMPPVYLHGDFHPGNLICTDAGPLGVIDFNRWAAGDPWEEFYKLDSFGIEVSVPYCIGQIDAYFRDRIPEEFWTVNAVYVAHASLYSVKWAERFGREEMDGMVRRAKAAFAAYDDFRRCIPKWYTDSFSRRYRGE